MCMGNCTDAIFPLEPPFDDDVFQRSWNIAAGYMVYQPWLFSLIGSTMIGLAGVLPLFVIPIEEGANLKNGASAGTLKMLLSFAVGGLLGDVFLHLLPEAWASNAINKVNGHPSMACGLWVLSGFLLFIIAEKMFAIGNESEVDADADSDVAADHGKILENNNCMIIEAKTKSFAGYGKDECAQEEAFPKACKNGYANGYRRESLVANGTRDTAEVRSRDHSERNRMNGYRSEMVEDDRSDGCAKVEPTKQMSGYLNLMANCIDNFTHGLAVGGGFLVSFRLGAFTTFAILVHEIPHEVGDFAILLKSGFSRWEAAKAQLMTASGGMFGALCAVVFSGNDVGSKTNWILPFTAGGFLHIGLVTVLPELLKESNPRESLKQLTALFVGIAIMAVLTIVCD